MGTLKRLQRIPTWQFAKLHIPPSSDPQPFRATRLASLLRIDGLAREVCPCDTLLNRCGSEKLALYDVRRDFGRQPILLFISRPLLVDLFRGLVYERFHLCLDFHLHQIDLLVQARCLSRDPPLHGLVLCREVNNILLQRLGVVRCICVVAASLFELIPLLWQQASDLARRDTRHRLVQCIRQRVLLHCNSCSLSSLSFHGRNRLIKN